MRTLPGKKSQITALFVGIIGSLITVTLVANRYVGIIFNAFTDPDPIWGGSLEHFLILIWVAILFFGGIFRSVGFVSVFSSKRSHLGLIFPISFLISSVMDDVVYYLYYGVHLFGTELMFIISLASFAITFVLSVIGGLAFLKVRKVCVNTLLVTILAIFYTTQDIIMYAANSVISMALGPGLTYVELIVALFPDFLLDMILSLMILVFFISEYRRINTNDPMAM